MFDKPNSLEEKSFENTSKPNNGNTASNKQYPQI